MKISSRDGSQKREYSRRGCRECKRRKIKCNEQKPQCYQCSRLNKTCFYPLPNEQVIRASKQYLSSHPCKHEKPFVIKIYRPERPRRSQVFAHKHDLDNNLMDSSYFGLRNNKTNTSDMNSLDLGGNNIVHSSMDCNPNEQYHESSNTIVKSLSYPELHVPFNNIQRVQIGSPETTNPIKGIGDTLSNDKQRTLLLFSPINMEPIPVSHIFPVSNSEVETTSPNVLDDLFNTNDLNILALDLNELVHGMMFNSGLILKLDGFGEIPSFDSSRCPLLTECYNLSSLYTNNEMTVPEVPTQVVPRHITIDSLSLVNSHERLYLEEFYHTSAMKIMPFSVYDEVLKMYFNPVRDTILYYARQEPFLLAAVIAEGARSSFNNNRLERDQTAYYEYLSQCLKLLEPALTTSKQKEADNSLTSNIECILLTVLLLTSANAISTRQSWRPHLKGARDIIMRSSKNEIRQSKTLILCKMWFIDFEILAGSSSDKGGTLDTDAEMNSIMLLNSDYEVMILKEYGMIIDKNFIVMSGYNIECLGLLRDLIKITNLKRNQGSTFKPDDPLEYLRLLSGFQQQYHVEFIDRKRVLPPGHVYHHEPASLIDTIHTNQIEIVVSWMDMTQQAYCLAGMITVLINFMLVPYRSPQIQSLVKKIIDLIAFLKDLYHATPQRFAYSYLMIQWPMLIAAVNCTGESQKYIILKFFRILIELGAGSAEVALKRINRVWDMREMGQDPNQEDDVPLDVVAY